MNKNILSGTATYPRFADGRIDYTHQRRCYGVMCIVMCGERILLVRRSDKVMAHGGLYSGISGFIDDITLSVMDTALLELQEEVNAPLGNIIHSAISEPIIITESAINREWVDYPVLIEFDHEFTPHINWEASHAGWYDISSVDSLELVPSFHLILEAVRPLRRKSVDNTAPRHRQAVRIYTNTSP